MIKILNLNNSKVSSQKILAYSLIFINLGIFLISTWSKQNVVVSSQDFLGLFAYLGTGFWIGLFLTLINLSIIWIYDINDTIISTMAALVLGLYLLAPPIFLQKNASFFVSYYPAGEVQTVLREHYINMMREGQLISYLYWPGLHTISASLMLILNLPLEPFLKYMPLFWIISFILLSNLVKRSFKFENRQYLLVIWLAIASFWVGQYYYSAQSFAILLYIIIMTFVLRDEVSIGNTLVILITFISLVLIHLLTPIAIIFSMVIISFYNRHCIRILILLGILFLAYYLYLSPIVFEYGIREFISQIINFDLYSFYKSPDFKIIASSPNYIMVHNIRLGFLLLFFILIIITGFGYLINKTNKISKKHFWSITLWVGGLMLLLGLQYGPEMQYRVYIYALLALLSLPVLVYPKAKFLIVFAVLFSLLHLPVHYGTHSFEQTIDQELAGAKFLALDVKPRNPYSYRFYPYVRYYDPSNLFVPCKTFIIQYKNETDLKNVQYISDSFQSNNYFSYVFDEDPVKKWINQNPKDLILIYDNGKFSTFNNIIYSKG